MTLHITLRPRSRNKTDGVVILTFGLAVGACGGSTGPVFAPVKPPSEFYAVRTATVTITDERKNVAANTSFDTPTFSSPGTKDMRELPLPKDLGLRFTKLSESALTKKGRNELYFEVHVDQAEAGWEATWSSETTVAKVHLTICVISGDRAAALAVAVATGSAQVPGLDVADDAPEKLLLQTLDNAFERYLSEGGLARGTNATLKAYDEGATVLTPDPLCEKHLTRPSSSVSGRTGEK